MTPLTDGDVVVRDRTAARRERLRDAATVAVREHGSHVSVAEIARRARIGVSGFYRLYASKDVLLDEIASARMDVWRRVWKGLIGLDDPAEAIKRGLWFIGEMQESEPELGALIRDRARANPSLLADVRAVTDDLLARAQAAGVIRSDLVWEDVRQLFLMFSALPSHESQLPWRRIMTLFIDSWRPEGATPLPTEEPDVP